MTTETQGALPLSPVRRLFGKAPGLGSDAQEAARFLSIRMMVAILLIAGLATAELTLSRIATHDQEADAHLINLSGRQRMLSQRITGLSQEIAREDAALTSLSLPLLRDAIATMRAAHLVLTQGDPDQAVPPPSDVLSDLYFREGLDAQVQRFLTHADHVAQAAAAGQTAQPSDVHALADASREPLLTALDTAVQLYQREAEEKQASFQNVLLGVWAGLLVGLAVIGVFVLRPTVTAIRHAMEALEEQRLEAEKANRAKSQFLSSMSHEIRTPMNGIIGMSDLLARADLAPTHRRHAQIVKKSARSLLTILNDILDVSKMEAGRLTLEVAPFNLKALVTETVESFGSQSAERGIDLSVEIGPALDIMVAGDPTRIRQILMNLVGNAIKFTAKGQVVVRVTVAGSNTDTVRIRFDVEDTGIGFHPAQTPHLFDAFTQADQSTTRKFGGTGLGLAIVKRLTDAMDGSVTAKGSPGKGAVFSVELPLKRLLDEAEEEHIPEPQKPASTEAPSILVAEDNETNQELMKAILRAFGFDDPVFAADGVKCVEAASSQKFDIIFMDSQMPNMDGAEACRIIRESNGPNRNSPIIALTADALDGAEERYLSKGFDAYLAKPIVPGQLVSVINEVFQESGTYS